LDWVSVPGTAADPAGTGRAAGAVGADESRGTGVEQAASIPTISTIQNRRGRQTFMGLILLEALVALLIFVAILWWTMFSGRKRGELPPDEED
jgi:cytoskeletal protein RodZ